VEKHTVIPQFSERSIRNLVGSENGLPTAAELLGSKEEGVFCGASTGLNVAGAIELAKEMKPEQRVITLACDSGLKYLGGHIYI
jgi:cysteine synthase